MPIYFASSDESGGFRKSASQRFIRSNPYYSRATVLTKAEDWKALRQRLSNLREKYNLPAGVEVKWSQIWSIVKHERNGEQISPNREYYLISSYLSSSQILDFADEVLQFMGNIDYCKIIITASDNNIPITIPESWHLERYLQEHMQRIEMELQNDSENLAVLFADHLSQDKDKYLCDAYHEIFKSGDFIRQYSHIKDSLNFEYSHHSAGIQLADFIAGCFNGILRGFDQSTNIFRARIKPYLRTDSRGMIMGYGIREVPRNDDFRRYITDKLS